MEQSTMFTIHKECWETVKNEIDLMLKCSEGIENIDVYKEIDGGTTKMTIKLSIANEEIS